MPIRHRAWAAFLFAAIFIVAGHARATDGPLLLFGGPNRDEFLGCLNCYRSEAYSVWNEKGEYGNPENESSIWNRKGPYGSPSSQLSPWNPRAAKPPLVVDRVDNLYGYLTLNRAYPKRIRPSDDRRKRRGLEMLAWLLDNYDWVVTHLEEVRVQY